MFSVKRSTLNEGRIVYVVVIDEEGWRWWRLGVDCESPLGPYNRTGDISPRVKSFFREVDGTIPWLFIRGSSGDIDPVSELSTSSSSFFCLGVDCESPLGPGDISSRFFHEVDGTIPWLFILGSSG